MDFQDSDIYEYFEVLVYKGMMALNKNIEWLLTVIKIMSFKS